MNSFFLYDQVEVPDVVYKNAKDVTKKIGGNFAEEILDGTQLYKLYQHFRDDVHDSTTWKREENGFKIHFGPTIALGDGLIGLRGDVRRGDDRVRLEVRGKEQKLTYQHAFSKDHKLGISMKKKDGMEYAVLYTLRF